MNDKYKYVDDTKLSSCTKEILEEYEKLSLNFGHPVVVDIIKLSLSKEANEIMKQKNESYLAINDTLKNIFDKMKG